MLTPRQKEIYRKVADSICNNRYRIGRLIGNGSYGLIFYGYDMELKRIIAIKVIDLGMFECQENLQKQKKHLQSTQQEIQPMIFCHGEHIMKCYDAISYEEEKLKLIVMEYCKLDCIHYLLCEKEYLPEIQAKKILKQLLFGLGELHYHGWCHRDIKTENICLCQDGIILADLGCARQFQEQKMLIRKSYSIQASIEGTIICKSPQMLAHQSYGFKTDFWSVGVLYYQMLLGFPPFHFCSRDLTNKEILQVIYSNIDRIYSDQYQKKLSKIYDLEGQRALLSHEAKQFLSKLLVINPKERHNWKSLLTDHYLIGKEKTETYFPVECILPLKDRSWEKFLPEIEKMEELSQKSYEEHHQKKIQWRNASIKKMDKGQIDFLMQEYKKNQEEVSQFHEKNKEIQFEVRRIELLMEVYEELVKINNKQLQPMRFFLAQVCFLKIDQFENNFKKYSNIWNNLRNEQFYQKVEKKYQEERTQAQTKIHILNTILNPSLKKNFNELNPEKVISLLKGEIKKYKKKFPEVISRKLIQFIEHNDEILKFLPVHDYFQDKNIWPKFTTLKQMHTPKK